MIRIAFSIMLAVHGFIHIIGFTKQFNLGAQEIITARTLVPLTPSMSKLVGVFSLLVFSIFIVSGFSYYLRKDWFWVVAAIALLLSQILIILYWQDAKWGTVANAIILIAVVLSYAQVAFDRSVAKEIRQLTNRGKTETFTGSKQISHLPQIIQRWMQQSGVMGKARPKVVHVVQQGFMRTEPSAGWQPFDAEQYFTIDPPGFVWKADIHTSAFIDIVGRDKYEFGEGNMLIKAASLIRIANSRGKEVDQGTMLRYMAEIIWFPQGALSDYLTWEQISEKQARLTMTYGGVTASGIYRFNEQGLPVAFEARRWGDFNGKYSLENWFVSITSYRRMGGIDIGATSEVTWKLKDRDFTWLRMTISEIKYQ